MAWAECINSGSGQTNKSPALEKARGFWFTFFIQNSKIEVVKAKVDTLLGKNLLSRTIYGWRPQFVLNRCATTAQIEAFQERCNCPLPEDYKQWIQTVGDGGVGLYALDAANDSGAGVVEIFCYPERLGGWELMSGHEKVDEHPMISLCSGGCEIEYFFVLSGPLRGSMCFSYFVEFNNYRVDSMNNKEGVTVSFLDWYESWLDKTMSRLK